MKKKLAWVAILVLVGLLASCGTDLSKKNADGSPIWTTTIPSGGKRIYGVGKARLTLDATSEQAADTFARSDLSKKIESTLKEFNTHYTMDTEGKTAQAYEQLVVETVNLTLRKVSVEQRWRAPDGTVWSLVSLATKELPVIYSETAGRIAAERINAQQLAAEVEKFLQSKGYDLSD